MEDNCIELFVLDGTWSQGNRVYSVDGKSVTQTAVGGAKAETLDYISCQ